MAADIAVLSLRIDSTGMKEAQQGLEKLSTTGAVVETMAKRLSAAFASYQIGTWAKETILLTARYDTLGVAMNAVGKNAGYTAATMTFYQRALQDTGISALEARNTLTMMAGAQLDLANSAKLARIAQDAAVIGNLNSSEAFERMIQGIRSGQVEILRTIGINVNFEQGYQKLAKTLGKTAADLSEFEKMQARTNQVIAYGSQISGVYEAAMGTAGKQIKSMDRYASDLQVSLGKVFQPTLKVVVDDMTTALKGSAEALERNNVAANKLGIAYGEMLRKAGGIPGVLSSLGTGTMGPTTLWKTFQAWRAQGRGEDPFKTDRVMADWSQVGMSESEGGEGGDPYGAIALAKKAAALEAAAKAAEAYAKVITPLNQALAYERILMGQGERAAYAWKLQMQNVHKADAAALLVKWDHVRVLKEWKKSLEELDKAEANWLKNSRKPREINPNIVEDMVSTFQMAQDAGDPMRWERQGLVDQAAALDRWKDTMPLENYAKALETIRLKDMQLRAQSGDTWAILGEVVTRNAGMATDHLMDWMNATDGLGRSWDTFGKLVQNVLRDLVLQMQRAIIQQKLMEPLFKMAGLAIAAGSGNGGTPSYNTGSGNYGDAGFDANFSMVNPVGGGKGGTNIGAINVHVSTEGGTSKVSGEGGGATQAQLGRLISAKVIEVMVDQKRPGGLLA